MHGLVLPAWQELAHVSNMVKRGSRSSGARDTRASSLAHDARSGPASGPLHADAGAAMSGGGYRCGMPFFCEMLDLVGKSSAKVGEGLRVDCRSGVSACLPACLLAV